MNNQISTKEKIIFGTFFAVFLVPEIIWGAVRNQVYELYVANFSQHTTSIDLLSDPATRTIILPVLYIQMIGILCTLSFLIVKRKKISRNIFLPSVVILGLITMLTFAVCFIAYAITHMTISF
jgi:hypothetical protein